MTPFGAARDHGRRGLRRAGAQLRRYFIAGVLVLAPVAITFWVLVNAFLAVERSFSGLFQGYERYVPGLGFLAGIIIVVSVGWFASNYVGGRLIALGERILGRIPIVSRIYKAAKQVGNAVLGQNRALFQQVVLVEYPRRDLYCLAFLTNEESGAVGATVEGDLVAVFLPTTPNPTSGFLLYVPVRDVRVLDLSVEEAMKLIISAGAFLPEGFPVAPPPAVAKPERSAAPS